MPFKDPEAGKAYLRAYQAAHREQLKAKARRYRERHKETIAHRLRGAAYRRLYGITIAQYDAMLTEQGGRCAICKADRSTGKGRFHVDHDHETGKVRGILCHTCNTKLGWVDRYLKEWTEYLSRADSRDRLLSVVSGLARATHEG